MSKKENVDICLYVVTHKQEEIKIKDRTYIHVGSGKKGCVLCDDTGFNISEKNPFYCELTALYWIWKNTNHDYVGIEHYRRMFGFNLFNAKNFFTISRKRVNKILIKYDVILQKKNYFKGSLLERHRKYIGASDFDFVEKIILEKFPDYMISYNKVMNSDNASMCNMMICKKELFDSYCEWLFSILFELEKYIDPTLRNGNPRRVYGYVAEKLLNVWIEHNGLKVKRLDVLKTDSNRFIVLLKFIKNLFPKRLKKTTI